MKWLSLAEFVTEIGAEQEWDGLSAGFFWASGWNSSLGLFVSIKVVVQLIHHLISTGNTRSGTNSCADWSTKKMRLYIYGIKRPPDDRSVEGDCDLYLADTWNLVIRGGACFYDLLAWSCIWYFISGLWVDFGSWFGTMNRTRLYRGSWMNSSATQGIPFSYQFRGFFSRADLV